MRRIVVLAGLMALTVAGALGAPACTANLLSAYIGASDCEIDGIIFSNFQFDPNGSTLTANSVTIYPQAAQRGFLATLNLTSFLGASHILLGYTIVNPFISNLELTAEGLTINGSAGVELWLGGPPPPGGGFIALDVPVNSQATYDPGLPFPGTAVVNKVYVQANPGGVAQVSSFENFVGIPEPVTFLLVGAGLLALGLVRRGMR